MSEGKVYFLEGGGRIKIGHSRDVAARVRNIATSSPIKLGLLGSVDGSHKVEKAVHRMLAEHRVKGEWFVDCPQVRAVLDLMREHGSGVIPLEPPKPPPQEETRKRYEHVAKESVFRPAWLRIEVCAERYIGFSAATRATGHYSGKRAAYLMGMLHGTTDLIGELFAAQDQVNGSYDLIVDDVMALVEKLENGAAKLFADTYIQGEPDLSGYALSPRPLANEGVAA
ncbi:MAG: GIY-YIG nuclease family protein [Pseudomonadota bacterium]